MPYGTRDKENLSASVNQDINIMGGYSGDIIVEFVSGEGGSDDAITVASVNLVTADENFVDISTVVPTEDYRSLNGNKMIIARRLPITQQIRVVLSAAPTDLDSSIRVTHTLSLIHI